MGGAAGPHHCVEGELGQPLQHPQQPLAQDAVRRDVRAGGGHADGRLPPVRLEVVEEEDEEEDQRVARESALARSDEN